MPSSHLYQLNEITELIKLSAPRRLLDVGIGFGKYGFLAREYLELWDGRQQFADWQRQIDGVEVFPDFVTPLQRQIYDTIHIGDAAEVLRGLPDDSYDLVLLIDILEHFAYDEGKGVLREALRVGRNVIVSTPRDIGHQGETFGNRHQRHVFQWRKEHLRDSVPHFFVPNRRSLIWFGGESAKEVDAARLSPHSDRPGVDATRRMVGSTRGTLAKAVKRQRGRLGRRIRSLRKSVRGVRRNVVRALRVRLREVIWIRAPYLRVRALARRTRSLLRAD